VAVNPSAVDVDGGGGVGGVNIRCARAQCGPVTPGYGAAAPKRSAAGRVDAGGHLCRWRFRCAVRMRRRNVLTNGYSLRISAASRHFASLRASTITSTAASTVATAFAVTADDVDANAEHPRRSGDGRLEQNDARAGSLQADVLGIKRRYINKHLPDGL